MLHLKETTKDFAGTPFFTRISWRLNKDEQVPLIGKNGSGEPTTTKVIAGQDEPSSGKIRYANRINFLPPILLKSLFITIQAS